MCARLTSTAPLLSQLERGNQQRQGRRTNPEETTMSDEREWVQCAVFYDALLDGCTEDEAERRADAAANRIPDPLFECMTADEVAECMSVPETLYARLWNDIVPVQSRAQTEAEVECDFSESNALEKFWHLFSEHERADLNRAARRYWVEVMGADG